MASALTYGLATGVVGLLDSMTLNLGGIIQSGAAGPSLVVNAIPAAVHAAMATWLMDNYGYGTVGGSSASKYLLLPATVGVGTVVLDSVIKGTKMPVMSSGAADLYFIAYNGLAAGLSYMIFNSAI